MFLPHLLAMAAGHTFLPSTQYVEMLLNLTHRAYIIQIKGFKMGIFFNLELFYMQRP